MGITSLNNGELAIATTKWPEGRSVANTQFGWSDLASSQDCLLEFDEDEEYWDPSHGSGPGGGSNGPGAYWFYGTQSYAAILSGSNLSILKEHQWIHGGGYETLPTGTDCRLGNPRMRQCNFNVVEAPDGGLVICGNTGHNFDDAYLAKLNFCYVIADFADLPLDGGVHLIEGPTPVVWDEDMDVRGSIVVDNDATLIIDGATIGFAPTTAQLVTNLKVLPGGRLELINGARLTTVSICEETTVWDGVIVLGDAMASQLPATAPVAQGYVEISGGSVIEHAITGIYVGDPNDLAAGGGVVRMNGTEANPPGTISNCRTGIYFRPYEYRPFPTALPGLVSNNQSVFQFARFNTDDFSRFSNDFIAEGHHAHVVLDEVSRVFFSACHFENSKPYDKSHLLGHGIEAIDSRISVRAACPAPPSGCKVGQRIPTTFRGLDHGIHALEGAFPSSYSIVDSHFENNICGVYANQASYLNVSKNTFELGGREAELTGPVDQEFQGYHRGVFVTGSNALKIEDNELWMAGEPNAEAEGIVVGYTYDANEVVRRNTATGVAKAFVGEGFAANLNTPDQAGLQFLYNSNTENQINFTSRPVTGAPGELAHSIRTTQGSPLRAAGNVFDATSGFTDYEVKTTLLPIKYHHLSTGGQEPLYYSDGTVDGELQPLDVSPYLHTGCYPLYVSDAPASLMLLLDSIHVVRDSVRGVLNGLIDGGDGEGLLDEIALLGPSDSTALYNDALSLSPYLSVQVLRAIVDQDILSKDKLSDVLAANPEATRYQHFLGWLEIGASVSVSPAVVEAVRASWEYPSPRWDIEMALGEMHAIASEVAHALLDHHLSDSLEVDSDSLLWALERLPTSGAALSQALLKAKEADFSAAYSVLSNAPLPDSDGFILGTEERDMMLGLIDALEMLHGEERTVRDLDSTEVASTLEGLTLYQDRAWHRISNIFCFHYGYCRPPLTGGSEAAPKMLAQPLEEDKEDTASTFLLYPNPTRESVTLVYSLDHAVHEGVTLLRDLAGRIVVTKTLQGQQGQITLETVHFAPGLYVVEVRGGGRVLHVEKLVVQ